MFRVLRKIVLSSLMLLVAAGSAWAAYPERPITLIVPFGAGGGTDIPARLLSGMMEKKLGKSIVVQNISRRPRPSRTAIPSAICPSAPCACSRTS